MMPAPKPPSAAAPRASRSASAGWWPWPALRWPLDGAALAAGRDGYFTISGHALDVHFRRARDRLLLTDLHFHDSRADALTRLSRRMDVMRLARVSGHRDLRLLLSTYYRESAADVAASL